jgi:cytochrome c-type biogenesis protein CcmH/NrfG
MRFTIRFGIVALFALVVAAAAIVGLAVGRHDVDVRRTANPTAPRPRAVTTDDLIESYLSRIQRQPDRVDGYTGLGTAYLQKARETGDPSYYGRGRAGEVDQPRR